MGATMNRPAVIAFFLACACWEILARAFHVPSYIFPSLSVVLSELNSSGTLIVSNLAVTGVEAIFGAFLGCWVGLMLGYAMAVNRIAEATLLPYVVGSNAVPVVAISPLLALWFGHGLASKIVVAAFLCFFPIAINVYEGLKDRGGVLRDLCQVMGTTREFYFQKIRMPRSLPFLLAGAKVSVVLAVVGAVVAEFVGSDAGLGFGMLQASYSLNTPRLFAYIVVSCMLGLAFYGSVVAVETLFRRSARWEWAFGQTQEAANKRP